MLLSRVCCLAVSLLSIFVSWMLLLLSWLVRASLPLALATPYPSSIACMLIAPIVDAVVESGSMLLSHDLLYESVGPPLLLDALVDGSGGRKADVWNSHGRLKLAPEAASPLECLKKVADKSLY